jgi:hypothetical protein
MLGLSVWPSTAEDKWKLVSSFQYDWDNHGAVNFVFEIPSAGAEGGGDFTRVRIQVPGQKEFVLTNEDGWVDYTPKEASISSKLPSTLAPSKKVLAVKAAQNRTLIFLFGFGYASSFGKLDMLEISDTGEPRLALRLDELRLEEVRDLDGDGIAEVIGKTCMTETWGNDLVTYSPFNIFKLNAISGGTAELSLPLSKSYNLKHYYGWAGPKCSDKVAVVLHPPNGGKPIVTSAKEAERMTAPKH